MSTLRVDTITNNGSAVNFTTNIQLPNGTVAREYYSQAEEPNTTTNGAVWWDTTNSVYKMLIEGEWYTVGFSVPPLPFVGDRGLFGGGNTGSYSNIIDYVTIPTAGNATDFGDLSSARGFLASCSNGTRGLFGGGTTGTIVNTIDYVTISTTGNAVDFGDLTIARQGAAACSNETRGLFGGGFDGAIPYENVIDYVTIATAGNAQDFGDLTLEQVSGSACSDNTYGLFGGGQYNDGGTVTPTAVISYVTISTLGNATSFGNLTVARSAPAACSNTTYGVWGGGGETTSFTPVNTIDYVTIATPSNATDFGDLTVARDYLGSCANATIGVFGGGNPTSNVIDYITIATPANATDFGDLTASRRYLAACSGD